MKWLTQLMKHYFMLCRHLDNQNIAVVCLPVLESVEGRMLGLLPQILLQIEP
jgi:hypothetical protein